MLDKYGNCCEYDGYVLPPAPKTITDEMRQRKKELAIKLDRLVEEANRRIQIEEASKK